MKEASNYIAFFSPAGVWWTGRLQVCRLRRVFMARLFFAPDHFRAHAEMVTTILRFPIFPSVGYSANNTAAVRDYRTTELF